ncbi:glycerophosphodiester phosphodiesterase family protein [Ideonella sp. A 288]|uniref:glycerophosphodiester phosphodiesterase family protein n=1 Tax=Ideonella sp. A 288 TaxID=1962181 RepID=UPI000B4A9025|nr:glycerophosphodiester phosphodiesterase family protein [Ideonella sp. A 288]
MKTTLGLVDLAAGLWCTGAAARTMAFDMQSHRGGRGLWPENTLVSFGNAVRPGTTTLESDAATTADGVVMISHEHTLDAARTRDASGQVLKELGSLTQSLSLAQMQAYDVGARPCPRVWANQKATRRGRCKQAVRPHLDNEPKKPGVAEGSMACGQRPAVSALNRSLPPDRTMA